MRECCPYREAKFQGRLWTPDELNPIYWFDASYGVGFTGSNVSSWKSRLTDITLTCSTGPVLGSTFLNGIPVMTFNTVQFIKTGESITGQNITFVSVYNKTTKDAPSTYPRLWSLSPTGSEDYGSTSGILFNAGQNSDLQVAYQNYAVKVSIANSLNNWYIGVVACSSSATNIWANGTKGTAGSGIGSLNVGDVRIGNNRAAADSGLKGHIAENMLFIKTLSDLEVQKIEGYCAWKWGLVASLPASHPFINRPPMIGD